MRQQTPANGTGGASGTQALEGTSAVPTASPDMSARRSSQLSVQLFPFLAVLMCALGALILMLLVVTSRMRDQARIRAAQSQQIVAARVNPPAPRERWRPVAAPPAPNLQPSSTSPQVLQPPHADA